MTSIDFASRLQLHHYHCRLLVCFDASVWTLLRSGNISVCYSDNTWKYFQSKKCKWWHTCTFVWIKRMLSMIKPSIKLGEVWRKLVSLLMQQSLSLVNHKPNFYGLAFSNDGLSPNPENVRSLREATEPMCLRGEIFSWNDAIFSSLYWRISLAYRTTSKVDSEQRILEIGRD